MATYGQIVGRVLRMQRELRGISLADMAAHLHLTKSAWSRAETGVSGITVNTLASVCARLDLSPADVLRMADKLNEELP